MATNKATKTPAERNKMILAIALGAVAIIALAYMLFGGSSSPKRNANANQAGGRTRQSTTAATNTALRSPEDLRQDEVFLTPVDFDGGTPAPVPEAGRNIFAFYVPPPPKPPPTPPAPTPVPTPTPVPPNLILASISPTNVYAHTGDFTLDVTGDKFTPETRIYMAGAELPTRFVSQQQLSTKVPAQLISFEGAREVTVRSRDGSLFSNTTTLNVMPAPVPNYTFIGVAIRKGSNDTAILKAKSGNEIVTVQRGDLVGGRFRVTSISVREVTLTDTSINIKHKLPLTGDRSSTGAPPGVTNQPRYTPPPPPPADDDDNDP